jgi:hypothetical protein
MPIVRLALVMRYGKNPDAIREHAVDEGIWESPKRHAPDVFAGDQDAKRWSMCDEIGGLFNLGDE